MYISKPCVHLQKNQPTPTKVEHPSLFSHHELEQCKYLHFTPSHLIELTYLFIDCHRKIRRGLESTSIRLIPRFLTPSPGFLRGKWNKLHNDGKSTTGGDFRSYSMSGSDGNHQVKVLMNGQAVISVIIESSYNDEKVKEVLRDAYETVRQV